MNELQLSAYRDLFGLGVHALRFFTVYGPRQRPDMAIARFTQAIAAGRPLTLFGDGSSRRDYTFIDDIVSGVAAAVGRVAPGDYELVNLGGTHTISLAELVETVERVVGRTAVIDRQPHQPGDVPVTYANIDRARALYGYQPTTRPDAGIARYWAWCQARGAAGPA
jgi:UDP-glucuronate 4-epimerase